MEERTLSNIIKFSIINLDKPTGPTSFQVSQFVKNLLTINKTSHLGTLDPQVSGVLPIALGRACRLSDFFMHRNKEYFGIMRLHNEVPEETLKKEIKKFVGKITQLPPIRSRVKRVFREREVKYLELIERKGKDFLFKTEVQAGTYIRKLIHDLGEKIGGAHMLELRRTKAGIFSEETTVTLYDLEKAVRQYKDGNETLLKAILIPAEHAIKKIMPSIQIKEKSVRQILTGKPLMKSDIFQEIPKEDIFALFHHDQLIAIVRKVEEEESIALPEFVYN